MSHLGERCLSAFPISGFQRKMFFFFGHYCGQKENNSLIPPGAGPADRPETAQDDPAMPLSRSPTPRRSPAPHFAMGRRAAGRFC